MKKNRYIFITCIVLYFFAIYIFTSLAGSIAEILKAEGEITSSSSISIISVVGILSVFYIVVSIIMLYGIERLKNKKLVTGATWTSIIILAIAFYFLNSNDELSSQARHFGIV